MRKSIKIFIFTLLFLFIISLSSCNRENKNDFIPIYEGMSIKNKNDRLSRYNYDFDIIDTKLDYYASKNEKMEVSIHLYNPKQFEILSFTINEKKYQTFEFLDGSTSEEIIISIIAPDISGEYSYTIDSIKYIDGTDIKDVNMSLGDKTINFGVSFVDIPSVKIKNEIIDYNSYKANFELNDLDNIINSQIGVRAYLFDKDDNYIKHIDVSDDILFSDLLEGTNYHYEIVCVYDLLDGSGSQTVVLGESVFKTKSPVNVNFIDLTSRLEYSIDCDNNVEVNKVELKCYDSNIIGGYWVEDITGSYIFDYVSLYLDYELIIEYSHNGNLCTKIVPFKCPDPVSPIFKSFNISVNDNDISFNWSYDNQSLISRRIGVYVYKNDSLFKEYNAVDGNSSQYDYYFGKESYGNGKIFDLEYDSIYDIKFIIYYNFTDGYGDRKLEYNTTIETKVLSAPQVGINYNIVKNKFKGDLILLDLDNTFVIGRYVLYDVNNNMIGVYSNIDSITDLAANTSYILQYKYTYNLKDGYGDRYETYSVEFSTSKVVPMVELKPYYIFSDSIGVDIYEVDPNVVGKIHSIRLYDKDGNFIAQHAAENTFEFKNLAANTQYRITVLYQYDLDDGTGSHDIEYIYDFVTNDEVKSE